MKIRPQFDEIETRETITALSSYLSTYENPYISKVVNKLNTCLSNQKVRVNGELGIIPSYGNKKLSPSISPELERDRVRFKELKQKYIDNAPITEEEALEFNTLLMKEGVFMK